MGADHLTVAERVSRLEGGAQAVADTVSMIARAAERGADAAERFSKVAVQLDQRMSTMEREARERAAQAAERRARLVSAAKLAATALGGIGSTLLGFLATGHL